MDKLTEDLVCQDCWVDERNRPRQCIERNCCCLLPEIVEDTPTLGMAIIGLLAFIIFHGVDRWGRPLLEYIC